MLESDVFNLKLVRSKDDVDKTNRSFYSTFPYPWPPQSLPVYPERLGLRLLNQDLGYWNEPKISGPLKIWVAGCGTNQAIFTALRFPECTVLATDVSTGSLEVARGTAAQIGIKNLTIVEQSINCVDFENEFDYVICTGVIHHNADPAYTLSKLVRALKKNGVMELMVYNYYQRLLTTAFQKAVRVLTQDSMDFVNEYRVAKTILTEQNSSTAMSQFVYAHKDMPAAQMADNLIQPVEYSYTVESLGRMLNNAGMEYMLPVICTFDRDMQRISWNMNFNDPNLNKVYTALDDNQRWYMTNLLMVDESPNLWFYCKKQEADFSRISEKEACEQLLDVPLKELDVSIALMIADEKRQYHRSQTYASHLRSPNPPEQLAQKFLEKFVNGSSMRKTFEAAGIKNNFINQNKIRTSVLTSAFPFLTPAHW